jgi:hypothetical protein
MVEGGSARGGVCPVVNGMIDKQSTDTPDATARWGMHNVTVCSSANCSFAGHCRETSLQPDPDDGQQRPWCFSLLLPGVPENATYDTGMTAR